MFGFTEVAHEFSAEDAGTDAVFCPESTDQMAFVGKAAVCCDFDQGFCGSSDLHAGGADLLPQAEGVDGHISDFFKIRF